MSKGDWRRPSAVPDADVAKNWCAQVGHRWSPLKDWCTNCLRSAEDIARDERFDRKEPTRGTDS